MPHYQLIDVLLLAIALVVMPIYSAHLGVRFARVHPDEARRLARYRSVIVRGIVVSSVILVAWPMLDRSYRQLGLGVDIANAGLAGFGVDALLACAFGYALFLGKPSPEKAAAMRSAMERTHTAPRTPTEFRWFPLVAIVGSVTEELLYRGYLFWALTPRIGPWGAAAVSSIAFGLAHIYQGRIGIVRSTFVGLVFAAGFMLTHSLWWLLLAHCMINLFGGLYAKKVRALSAASPAAWRASGA